MEILIDLLREHWVYKARGQVLSSFFFLSVFLFTFFFLRSTVSCLFHQSDTDAVSESAQPRGAPFVCRLFYLNTHVDGVSYPKGAPLTLIHPPPSRFMERVRIPLRSPSLSRAVEVLTAEFPDARRLGWVMSAMPPTSRLGYWQYWYAVLHMLRPRHNS